MSGTSRYEIDIVANNKASRALSKTNKQLGKINSNAKKSNSALKTMGTLAASAGAALGTIKLAQSFLNTAKQFENLGVQLKFITGNAKDGARALGIVEEAASKSAFAMSDMANAAPLLLTVGSVDQLGDSLDIVGDIAAATGIDFNTTAEQIQRAFSGGIASADIFREKGVKSMLGFQEGVEYTAEETERMIREAFENGTTSLKGATAEMAKTWTGQLSMMGDKWDQFKLKTMESGLFPALKKQLGDLDKFFKDNAQAIDDMAVALGEGLAAAVIKIGEAVAFIAEHSDKFATAAKILIGLKLASWAIKAAMAMRTLATGVMTVMAFSGPPGWAAIATGIATLTLGTLALNKAFGETTESFSKDELGGKISETEARIKELTAANAELETQMKDLGTPFQDFTIDLNDTNNVFKSLEDQVIQIPNALDHVTNSMASNSAEIFLLEKELASLKTMYDEIEPATADLSNRNEELAESLSKVNKEVSGPDFTKFNELWGSLRSELFPVQTEIAKINSQIDLFTKAIADGHPEADLLSTSIVKMKQRLAELNPETQAIIEKLAGYKDAVVLAAEADARAKTQLDNKVTAMNSLKESLFPLETQMNTYSNQIDTLNYLIENNIGNTDEWRRMIVELRKQMALADPETQALIERLTGYQDAVLRAKRIQDADAQSKLDLKEAALALYDSLHPLETQLKTLTEQQDINRDAYEKQLITIDQYIKTHNKLKDKINETKDSMKGLGNTVKETTEDMRTEGEKYVDSFNKDFNRKLADGLANGTLSFQTFAGSWKKVLADLINDTLNKGTLLKDILGMFGNIFGGSSKGPGFQIPMMAGPMDYLQGSPISGMVAGPMDFLQPYADGGKIAAGETGIVGEAGAELVTGPATVTPNKEIGGAKPAVNITIQAIDTQTGTEFLLKNKKQIEGIIQHAYNRRGKQGIY
jgi:predicted  nucleic acid-binding Zn-ribbon protein